MHAPIFFASDSRETYPRSYFFSGKRDFFSAVHYRNRLEEKERKSPASLDYLGFPLRAMENDQRATSRARETGNHSLSHNSTFALLSFRNISTRGEAFIQAA
jgi:hypothetical protein